MRKNAGVIKLISFVRSDVLQTKPHASHGLCIVNPPYGERLEEKYKFRTFIQVFR